jgi:16S rRNA (adenine1518-N6/adenine1519-N6)-dimethyltransferase
MSLKQELLHDLAAAGVPPLHRFGQNFMIDASALEAMLGALGDLAGSRVLEVGPGTGLLTRRLLERGAQVLAVEIDRGLHAHLARTLALSSPALELILGDCLASKSRLHPAIEAFAQTPWSLGSNLPYEVSLPVILNAVALPLPPTRLVVTVQFEAAQRLCSRPGQEAWGGSAAVLQAAGVAKLLRRLVPGSFYPAPRVDSAILSWSPRAVLPAGFGAWMRRLFSSRRKVLPGALRDAGMTRPAAEEACRGAGLDSMRRVEQLDAPELLALFLACQALLVASPMDASASAPASAALRSPSPLDRIDDRPAT